MKEEVKGETVHSDLPAGSQVLASKKSRGEQEMFFVGKGKTKDLKRQAHQANQKPTKEDQKVKHTLASMETFASLGITPPVTTAAVPAVIATLEEKLAGYKVKVTAWEASREERLAAATVALANAKAKAEDLEKQADEAIKAAEREKAIKADDGVMA